MKNAWIFLCILVLSVILFSCGSSINSDEARIITQRYCHYLTNEQFDSLATLFDPGIGFGATTINECKNIRAENGKVVSAEFVGEGLSDIVLAGKKVKRLERTYTITYANKLVLRETFSFLSPSVKPCLIADIRVEQLHEGGN